MCFTDNFSHPVTSFHFLDSVFERANFFILIKCDLSIFKWLVSYLRSLPNLRSQRFFSVFFFTNIFLTFSYIFPRLWSLYSTQLIFMSVLTQMPFCLDSCSLTGSLEIRQYKSSKFVTFQNCIVYIHYI